MDILEIFGGNVARLRHALSLTQEQLAELAGLHRTYIGDIETCRRNVSLENVARLAAALQVEPYVLLMEVQ